MYFVIDSWDILSLLLTYLQSISVTSSETTRQGFWNLFWHPAPATVHHAGDDDDDEEDCELGREIILNH